MSFIGGAIRASRKRAGLTGKQMAEQTKFSPQYIGDIEMGRRVPPPETVLAICNLFPDEDPAWWLWLLLRDSWGSEIATTMERFAARRALGSDEE
jgi:transcriptional regulator with XRE-family HTH domain